MSSQLIGAIQGRIPKPENMALNVAPGYFPGDPSPIGLLRDYDFEAEIWRWVRGFHAALYEEHLASHTLHEVFVPVLLGEVTSDGPQFTDDHLPIQEALVQQIKMNRQVDRLDEIECNNSKLRYWCLWVPPKGRDRWECWLGLKIYEWQNLGDSRFPRRACIGRYVIDGAPPTGASTAVQIHVRTTIDSPLDPFF